MSCQVRVDAANGCALFRWRDTVLAKNAAEALQEFERNNDFRRDLSRFSDLRQVTWSIDQARAMVPLQREFLRRYPEQAAARFAILVGNDADFGTARLFISETGYDNAAVFRRLDEALAWLGLPAEVGDPFANMGTDADGETDS